MGIVRIRSFPRSPCHTDALFQQNRQGHFALELRCQIPRQICAVLNDRHRRRWMGRPRGCLYGGDNHQPGMKHNRPCSAMHTYFQQAISSIGSGHKNHFYGFNCRLNVGFAIFPQRLGPGFRTTPPGPCRILAEPVRVIRAIAYFAIRDKPRVTVHAVIYAEFTEHLDRRPLAHAIGIKGAVHIIPLTIPNQLRVELPHTQALNTVCPKRLLRRQSIHDNPLYTASLPAGLLHAWRRLHTPGARIRIEKMDCPCQK